MILTYPMLFKVFSFPKRDSQILLLLYSNSSLWVDLTLFLHTFYFAYILLICHRRQMSVCFGFYLASWVSTRHFWGQLCDVKSEKLRLAMIASSEDSAPSTLATRSLGGSPGMKALVSFADEVIRDVHRDNAGALEDPVLSHETPKIY